MMKFRAACGRALERLGAGASLVEVLGLVVDYARELESVAACVVLFDVEKSTPIRVSNLELTPEVIERLWTLEVDGRIIIDDLATHPKWSDLAVTLEHDGIRALWSEPIEGVRGAVRFFRRTIGVPDQDEIEHGEDCAQLAAIAISRKRREDELLEREAQISGVLEAVIDGIITIDQRGTVESFNRAAEKMFGYSADEVIGRNVKMLMTQEIAKDHDSYLRRYLATGERHIIGIGREVIGRRKDGTTFPLDLGVSELWVGEQRKFTGILRDLTVRKRLEAQVTQSQKLEAVGRLAAGVSHDFNNLLMGITGCMSIVLSKMSPESKERVFIEEAKSAAERGSRLTRQLLAFSRRTPTEARPMLINDVLQGTELMLRRLVTEEISLAVELDPSGGPILGDVGQIEQILVNLVVNSRDAIDGGGTIRIRTSTEQGNPPRTGFFVCLTVSDTGCGMDQATQAHVFEPFFTTKGPDRGTGLGLSTVYGIVEQHGGFIEIDSAVGRGTSVRIYFPHHQVETGFRLPLPGEVGSGGEKILVVEDDRLVRLGIVHFLESIGYRVTQAASVREAMDQIGADGGPDVLLTDLVMPDASGLDLIAHVESLRRAIALLVMSGYADPDKLQRLRAQDIPFLEKPFSYEELAQKLRSVLDQAPRVPAR